jgi:hypothetical protein
MQSTQIQQAYTSQLAHSYSCTASIYPKTNCAGRLPGRPCSLYVPAPSFVPLFIDTSPTLRMRWRRTIDASFQCFHLKPPLRLSFGRHLPLLSTSPRCRPGPRPLFGLLSTLNPSGRTRWVRGDQQWWGITAGGRVRGPLMQARLRIVLFNGRGRDDFESRPSRTEVTSVVVLAHVCCSPSQLYYSICSAFSYIL